MIDFIIVGAQKSASTMIKQNLNRIDNIFLPKKELHFFDLNFDKGINWYESHFKYNKINGEKTPNYMNKKIYIDRIKKHYPNTKIIIILRNPILRAISHWNHFNQVYDTKSKLWGWIYKDELYDSIKVNEDILYNGLYYEKIKYIYDNFDKKNIYVCITENFKLNPDLEFSKLCSFIGVKNINLSIKSYHKRKYNNNIYIKDVLFLINYYRSNLKKLYKLLGYRISDWDNFIDIYEGDLYEPISDIKDNNLTCLITCVNYSDILKYTLSVNLKIIQNIIIITDYNDKNTVNLCKKLNIKYIQTDLFYKKEKIKLDSFWNIFNFSWWYNLYQKFSNKKNFNKAKVINYVIKNHVKTDWVLLIDADIIISEKFKNIDIDKLKKDYLYGTYRIIYKTKQDWINNENAIFDYWKFIGFFQLFNIKADSFSENYYGYDEQFNYANYSDYFFMKKWNQKKELLDFPVIHLGEIGQNWKGRNTKLWN